MQHTTPVRGALIAFCVCLALLSTAKGQLPPPSSGTVTVNVARLAQVHVQVQPLAFGWIAPGQTKTLPPNTSEFLRFMVEGEPSGHISVTFPKTTTLYRIPGGEPLQFTREEVWAAHATNGGLGGPPAGYWVFLPNDASVTNEVVLPGSPALPPPPNPSGKCYFWIGGRLTAGSSQPAGYYWGDYTVVLSNYYM